MAAQWREEQKLEIRRMDGSSLQLEVMHKVPELLVHERSRMEKERTVPKRRQEYQDGLLKRCKKGVY